jgi:hypothetical protein
MYDKTSTALTAIINHAPKNSMCDGDADSSEKVAEYRVLLGRVSDFLLLNDPDVLPVMPDRDHRPRSRRLPHPRYCFGTGSTPGTNSRRVS